MVSAYGQSGVDYSALDPVKVRAQQLARETEIHRFRMTPESWSRGESVFVYHDAASGHFIGHLQEGLGTKNIVADKMKLLTGNCYYRNIGQDLLAMMVNDMATLGLSPVSVAMHLAAGESSWFEDRERYEALLLGFAEGCKSIRCNWAGGETPTLKDIIIPGASELSGSAVGRTARLLKPDDIRHGDKIVMFGSSGIHANGLTLARKIADWLPDGYLTDIGGGQSYGEALLAPTHLYSNAVDTLIKDGVKLRYGVNITGHGWRKLMRAKQPFRYVITELGTVPPVLEFIASRGRLDDGPLSLQDAYGDFNMGAGFALFVAPESVEEVLKSINFGGYPFRAWEAGYIRKAATRSVHLHPLDLTFDEASLQVR